MELSKDILYYFAQFFELTPNFEHLEKKMTLIDYVFPKLHTVKDMLRQIFKYPHFRAPFESQHVKASQTLMKPAWEHFYDTL